jgi:hypothetical protein
MSVNQKRISEKESGYLELRGAEKDGDCEVVQVAGGVSKDLGCCNTFKAENQDTQIFSCGTCFYLERDKRPEEEKPLGKQEARGMTFGQILDSQRPTEEER